MDCFVLGITQAVGDCFSVYWKRIWFSRTVELQSEKKKTSHFSLTNAPNLASFRRIMLISPNHNSRRISLRAAITRYVAPLVLLLFLCSQLHAVFHHHDDLGDHSDCSICAVVHHQSADHSLPFSFINPAPVITQVQSLFTDVIISASAPKTYPSRAPPL